MKTRLLIHYLDGKTFIGEWNKSYDFKNLCNKPISSVQIQQNNGVYHTLSCKKKQFNTFWQRDSIVENNLVQRSILRRLRRNIWLELKLYCINGKRKITIIEEDIKVN